MVFIIYLLLCQDILPMHKYLKGLCVNETRILAWNSGSNLDLSPTPVDPNNLIDLEEMVSIKFTVEHITEPDDYQIFGAWREGNLSLVLDLIEKHKGINAVDEWGQTILMHAVQKGSIETVSALLNTRMPKVDVNKAKSVRVIYTSYCRCLKAEGFEKISTEWFHSCSVCNRSSIYFDSESSSSSRGRPELSNARWGSLHHFASL